eukprot:scaffold1954_cov268-Pinguiococcus_pyrenoidosus.AAC.21
MRPLVAAKAPANAGLVVAFAASPALEGLILRRLVLVHAGVDSARGAVVGDEARDLDAVHLCGAAGLPTGLEQPDAAFVREHFHQVLRPLHVGPRELDLDAPEVRGVAAASGHVVRGRGEAGGHRDGLVVGRVCPPDDLVGQLHERFFDLRLQRRRGGHQADGLGHEALSRLGGEGQRDLAQEVAIRGRAGQIGVGGLLVRICGRDARVARAGVLGVLDDLDRLPLVLRAVHVQHVVAEGATAQTAVRPAVARVALALARLVGVEEAVLDVRGEVLRTGPQIPFGRGRAHVVVAVHLSEGQVRRELAGASAVAVIGTRGPLARLACVALEAHAHAELPVAQAAPAALRVVVDGASVRAAGRVELQRCVRVQRDVVHPRDVEGAHVGTAVAVRLQGRQSSAAAAAAPPLAVPVALPHTSQRRRHGHKQTLGAPLH